MINYISKTSYFVGYIYNQQHKKRYSSVEEYSSRYNQMVTIILGSEICVNYIYSNHARLT